MEHDRVRFSWLHFLQLANLYSSLRELTQMARASALLYGPPPSAFWSAPHCMVTLGDCPSAAPVPVGGVRRAVTSSWRGAGVWFPHALPRGLAPCSFFSCDCCGSGHFIGTAGPLLSGWPHQGTNHDHTASAVRLVPAICEPSDPLQLLEVVARVRGPGRAGEVASPSQPCTAMVVAVPAGGPGPL